MSISGYTILLNGQSFIIDGKEPYEERLSGTDGATTEVVTTTTQTSTTDTPKEATAATPFGGSIFSAVLIYAAVFGGAYFFWIKPQKKKEQKVREMQLQITTGNDVITSSGFYGKVVDVTDKAFVIEFGTNKGVRVPVRKEDVFLSKDSTVEEKTKLSK